MNRTEFVIATAIILLVAFAMGWFTHWLLHRFTRVQGGDMAEMDRWPSRCTRPKSCATRRWPIWNSARPS
jgi:hypothetical protein